MKPGLFRSYGDAACFMVLGLAILVGSIVIGAVLAHFLGWPILIGLLIAVVAW